MSDPLLENWLQFDLKIRNLVSSLFEPTLAKYKLFESFLTKLQNSDQSLNEKIINVQSKVDELNSRIPSLEASNKRLAEQCLRVTSLEAEMKSLNEGLKNQIESISSSLGSVSSQTFSLTKQNEIIRKDLKDYASGHTNAKRILEDRILEIRRELKEPFESQSEISRKSENRIRQIEKSFDQISKEVSLIDFVAQKNETELKSSLKVFEEKLAKIGGNLEKNNEEFGSFLKGVKVKLREDLNENLENMKEFVKKSKREEEDGLLATLELVLTEPRYRKRLEEVKKLKGVLKPANVIKENLESKSFMTHLQESNEGVFLTREVSEENDRFSEKFDEFLCGYEERERKQNSQNAFIRCLVAGLKVNFESKISEIKRHFEEDFKDWISSSAEGIRKELKDYCIKEDEKRNLDIKDIKEKSEKLETIMKQATYEFSSFVSNRKRENSDFKLDIKKIYSKFEGLSRDYQRCADLYDRLKNSLKAVKELIALQNQMLRNDENSGKDGKKLNSSKIIISSNTSKGLKGGPFERIENLLDVLGGYLEENHSYLTQRCNTPELPFIRKN